MSIRHRRIYGRTGLGYHPTRCVCQQPPARAQQFMGLGVAVPLSIMFWALLLSVVFLVMNH